MLVITTRIANNYVHRMLVDNGSVIDILYLDTYKRMRFNKRDSSPTTTPLYGFTGDHVIPKSTIKLVVTVGEHLRVSIVVIDFLVVNCPLVFIGVLGRPLLKTLKAVTSIYHLTMKLPTVEGT